MKAFVSMTLSEDARRAVEDHVDDCADCRQLLVALVRTAPPVQQRWQPGDRVGRYTIGASVGRGAMGEVFRGDDTELSRPVALKRLHAPAGVASPHLAADGRGRLVREARAAAQLQHPNVVAVYEIVTDGDDAVLACEWVDGVTLRDWLSAPDDRTWRDVLLVVAGAGRGLAAAHAAGIVHRDFKPENVLVDREGRARVADFGLASGFDVAEGTRVSAVTPLRVTVTGTIAGTPAYMAPELIDGGRPDARSDQFAFAVTLFEAVHGKYPFAGGTAEAIWASMATGRIVKRDRRVPAWLDRALEKALAPEPHDRFESLDALLDLIERRSRRGMGIPLAVAGAIGGIAVAGLLMALPSRSEQAPCGDGLVDDVWSQAVRAGYAKQFMAVSPSRSAASLAFADQVLEQWTGSWRLGRRAACAAEPQERKARTVCLDRVLGDLRAQLAVWSRADASIVDRTAQAVSSLPSPVECTSAVAAAPPSPAFATANAEVDALRRAGKFVEAGTKIGALVAAAANEEDLIAKARAYFSVASVEYELRKHAEARTHLAIAAQAARQAGDDRLLAETLVLDAATRIVARKPAEALGLCDAVDSLMPKGPIAARLESVRGEALTALRRPEEGIAAYQRAVAILETLAARDPSLRLQLAANIGAAGTAMGHAGRPQDALVELERCRQIEEPLLGPNHPELGRTLFDMAHMHHKIGDFDKAITIYQRVRVIFVAALGESSLEVAAIDGALADMALSMGDLDKAYALATSAQKIYASSSSTPALLSSIETALGNIEQNRDRCAAAIPHYERALVAAKEAGEVGSRLAISYANVAGCLADVRRDAEARNELESALSAWDSDPAAGPERAHALAILADLEARGGRFRLAIETGDRSLAILKGLEGEPWQAIREHVTESQALWRRGRTE
ncbi:MAG: serine/threonine-protein kinase [Myxococcota bacterium]|nr:serine/threonine-protein kinase [Myxococcota bacterium]